MATFSGWYGIALLVDPCTVGKMSEHAHWYAKHRCLGLRIQPEYQMHVTLFHSPLIQGLKECDARPMVAHVCSRLITHGRGGPMFSIRRVNLSMDRFLVCPISRDPVVTSAYEFARDALAQYIPEHERQVIAAEFQANHPNATKQTIKNLEMYGQRFHRYGWRPQLMIGVAPPKSGLDPLTGFLHLGCFTHVVFAAFGPDGEMRQILHQLPIV